VHIEEQTEVTGMQIEEQTEVTGMQIEGGRVLGWETTRGPVWLR